MGAAHGKSKKELKEEAREWALTKENEVAQLYEQNTQLRNQIMMMQVDIQAFRDMLKGQQSALNESVKQMEERMTEMENDVKVVPFELSGSGGSPMPVSLGTDQEQEVYYRSFIQSEDPDVWKNEGKRRDVQQHFALVGRVYSLKQFEKVYIDECKYKKINKKEQSDREVKAHSVGDYERRGLIRETHGVFPNTSRKLYWKNTQLEPEW